MAKYADEDKIVMTRLRRVHYALGERQIHMALTVASEISPHFCNCVWLKMGPGLGCDQVVSLQKYLTTFITHSQVPWPCAVKCTPMLAMTLWGADVQ